MKVGLQIARFNWPGSPDNVGERLLEIAQAAEEAGFASLWVMDHFYQFSPLLGAPDDPMLEGFGAIHYMAAVTQRIKLGVLVAGVTYREPALLVKAGTSLDVVSGGRAYFGIGAAGYEAEARGMGFPFPSVGERFERLEEALQIARQMWAGDRSPYHGVHYKLEEPILSPQPLSRPHPPILIGGMGEKRTLRLVAQYGDACNLFSRAGTEVLTHKLDVLRRHCDDLGRDYQEIEKTTLGSVHLAEGRRSPEDVIQLCTDLAGLGIGHAIFNMPNVHEIQPIHTMGREVIPAAAEL